MISHPHADALAKFFIDKFGIPSEESAELPYLPDDEFDSELKTFRVKENQIQSVLKKLDDSKSVGLDVISSQVLTQCASPL